MRRNSLYSEKQWDWVVQRYLEGYNPLQLAEFLGVWRNAVIYRLKKAGVYNRLTPLSERKAEFLELCDEEL